MNIEDKQMEEEDELGHAHQSTKEKEKSSFLQQEYFYLHGIADSFDQKALNINDLHTNTEPTTRLNLPLHSSLSPVANSS